MRYGLRLCGVRAEGKVKTSLQKGLKELYSLIIKIARIVSACYLLIKSSYTVFINLKEII